MINLVPQFITDRVTRGETHGKFRSVTLFLDITGFTKMTETLMSEGKEGAEIVNRLLAGIFDPVIDIIDSYGGFISGFAGDAFTAIFISDNECGEIPPELALSVVAAAAAIRAQVSGIGAQETRFGRFRLSVKIGLSAGDTLWGVAGTEFHKTWYFRGPAIDGCAASENRCSGIDIIVDSTVAALLGGKERTPPVVVKEIEPGFFLLKEISRPVQPISGPDKVTGIGNAAAELFFPARLLHSVLEGEFRNVSSVFLAFKEPTDEDELNTLITGILTLTDNFGGYFNRVSFGDKGGFMLVFFGAPMSHEDDIWRAAGFVTAVKEKYGKKIRAGLTSGPAFAGFTGGKKRGEYTCLGNVVNLAARLMVTAGEGLIRLPEETAVLIGARYETRFSESREFKGFTKPVAVYELGEVKPDIVHFRRGGMIGREAESDTLREWTAPLFDGKFCGIIYIWGEAGAGKSRLAFETAEILKPRVHIMSLQADGIIRSSLNSFSSALKNHFRQNQGRTEEEKRNLFEQTYDSLLKEFSTNPDPRGKEQFGELERIKSFIGALLGHHWQGSVYERLGPKERHENTLYALKSFFKALSLTKPLLLLLEDLHWLDADSCEALTILTRNMDGFPLLVIATGRPSDDGTKPELHLDGDVPQHTMEIGNLSAETIGRFVEKHLPNPPDQPLISFVREKTLGNPFYMEQFCLYLLENEFLTIEAGLSRLTGNPMNIPSGITAIITARIDRLSAELREAVQTASVLGNEFDTPVLYELLKTLRTALVRSGFDSVISSGEKEMVWSVISQTRYAFAHALLRDGAYEMQLKERLREIHRLASRVIERLDEKGPGRYAEIAWHADRGEDFELAAKYYEKAGDFLSENYKNSESVKAYERLLELNQDRCKEGDILLRKGSVLELTGKCQEAETAYRKASSLAEEFADRELTVAVNLALCRLFRNTGRYAEAFALFEEVSNFADNVGDENLHAQVEGEIGHLYQLTGDLELALPHATASVGFFRESTDKRAYSKALGQLAIVLAKKGDFSEAMRCFETKKKIDLEIHDRRDYAQCIGNIGRLYRIQYDWDNAMKHYILQRELTVELGDMSAYVQVTQNIGEALYNREQFDEAMNCYTQARDIAREIGNKRWYGLALCGIANIFSDIGKYGESISLYDEIIAIFGELNIRSYQCEYLHWKAETCFLAGDHEAARTSNKEAKSIAGEIDLDEFIFACTVLDARIDGATGSALSRDKAIADLTGLLKGSNDPDKNAHLHYALYELTGNPAERAEALKLYEHLYQERGEFEIKKKLNKLKG